MLLCDRINKKGGPVIPARPKGYCYETRVTELQSEVAYPFRIRHQR